MITSMVMMPEPLANAIESLSRERKYDELIYMTPDGDRFDQKMANQLSLKENILIICGHYKGIDDRIREHYVTREISVGDLFEEIRHVYPGKSVHLKFFTCQLRGGEPQPLDVAELRWLDQDDLMTRLRQFLAGRADGTDDAVDLRLPGIRDDYNSHPLLPNGRLGSIR